MRRQLLAGLSSILMLMAFSAAALAINGNDEDTDSRMVNARVVEVSDMRISVIARSGVEHVISIDNSRTKVTIEGREVSVRDLREGDVVTIQLDEHSQVNFARNIQIGSLSNTQVARAH